MRDDGYTIAQIAKVSGVSERQVQAAMREFGLRRDQRPTQKYTVTVMVPELITVWASSRSQAAKTARDLYNDNVRIQCVTHDGRREPKGREQ